MLTHGCACVISALPGRSRCVTSPLNEDASATTCPGPSCVMSRLDRAIRSTKENLFWMGSSPAITIEARAGVRRLSVIRGSRVQIPPGRKPVAQEEHRNLPLSDHMTALIRFRPGGPEIEGYPSGRKAAGDSARRKHLRSQHACPAAGSNLNFRRGPELEDYPPTVGARARRPASVARCSPSLGTTCPRRNFGAGRAGRSSKVIRLITGEMLAKRQSA